MDIPELVGEWVGPTTGKSYLVPLVNKIILIDEKDRVTLKKEYGKDKLPII